jgi:hypothetical protein
MFAWLAFLLLRQSQSRSVDFPAVISIQLPPAGLPISDISSRLSKRPHLSSLWSFWSNVSYQSVRDKWHIGRVGGFVSVIDCCFHFCHFGVGGAIDLFGSDALIYHCLFLSNFAKTSGAVSIADSHNSTVIGSLFVGNSARRFGAMHCDGHFAGDFFGLSGDNFTANSAREWIGGLRMQHCGGFVKESVFDSNRAEEYGAFWDFSHRPGVRSMTAIVLVNNSAEGTGAGFTGFHMHFQGQLNASVFARNRNGDRSPGTAVILFSDGQTLTVSHCAFDCPRDEAFWVGFGDTSEIREAECVFLREVKPAVALPVVLSCPKSAK